MSACARRSTASSARAPRAACAPGSGARRCASTDASHPADAQQLRTKAEAAAAQAPATLTAPGASEFGATGGAQPVTPLGPGQKATLGRDGLAIAPASAPEVVKQIIAAGNEIAKAPYRYGGGHGKWDDTGYDCSGSMSYAFHGAGLIDKALDSTDFMSWGDPGPGQWVTIYAHGGHSYMLVAGLRFDTSGAKEDGSRWHTSKRSTDGYTVRHPTGL